MISHKPFEEWQAKQNTCYRVQPVTGTRLKNNQIKLQVYRTPQTKVWQRMKGRYIHE